MKLSKTASAFGLYNYGRQAVNRETFERFYSESSALFEGLGISPTYVGINGDAYPDDYRKHGSRAHQKLLDAEFGGIRGLSIVANPETSNEPSYDAYAEVSFGFAEPLEEVTLCFVVNESFARFAGMSYDVAWKSFLDLNAWDFGYGFVGEVEKDPGLHILGADNGKLTTTEQTSLNAWYAAQTTERLSRLRDVYPYNFVSSRQLKECVLEGVALSQFIDQNQYGELTRLTDYGLHLWKLGIAEANEVRAQLQNTEALIASH